MQNVFIIKTMNLLIDHYMLPNKPLTNHEILQAIDPLNIQSFKGVFSRNELSSPPNDNECGILNLDDSHGTGTHWVAWFKQGVECIYFDSFGIKPPLELQFYLNHDIQYNTRQIQRETDVICGHLCLYVLKMLSDGNKYLTILFSLY